MAAHLPSCRNAAAQPCQSPPPALTCLPPHSHPAGYFEAMNMVKALRPTFNYNFGRAATTDWPRPEPMWTGPPRPHSLAPPSLTRPALTHSPRRERDGAEKPQIAANWAHIWPSGRLLPLTAVVSALIARPDCSSLHGLAAVMSLAGRGAECV